MRALAACCRAAAAQPASTGCCRCCAGAAGANWQRGCGTRLGACCCDCDCCRCCCAARLPSAQLLGGLPVWQAAAHGCCAGAAAGVPCQGLQAKGDDRAAATGLLAGGVCTPLAPSSSASVAAPAANASPSTGAGSRDPGCRSCADSMRTRLLSCVTTGRLQPPCSASRAATPSDGRCHKAAGSVRGGSGSAVDPGAAAEQAPPGPDAAPPASGWASGSLSRLASSQLDHEVPLPGPAAAAAPTAAGASHAGWAAARSRSCGDCCNKRLRAVGDARPDMSAQTSSAGARSLASARAASMAQGQRRRQACGAHQGGGHAWGECILRLGGWPALGRPRACRPCVSRCKPGPQRRTL